MYIEDDIITVFGSSLLFPISKLFEELYKIKQSIKNEVKVSDPENGYSVSIITLSILMLESYVNRLVTILLSRNRISTNGTTKKPRHLLEKEIKDQDLKNKMNELFVIRDIIVHNHIWSARIIQEKGGLRFKENPKMDERFYGDKKFKKFVDIDKRKTKILSLNAFPIKIGRKDAIIVFRKVYYIIRQFEINFGRFANIDMQPVIYKGKRNTLRKYVQSLQVDGFDEDGFMSDQEEIAERVPGNNE